MNIETLTGPAGLKDCAMGTELPSFSVSVVGSSVEVHDDDSNNTATPSVTYVNSDINTRSCHDIVVNGEAVTTLVSSSGNHTNFVQHDGDVSMLSGESDGIGQQVVQQLHIHHRLEDRSTDNSEDNHEMILVYQDIFSCGACSKQFVDLIEFLDHKTGHTIGEFLHKCDLCQMVFRSRELITDHYKKMHQIAFYESDKDLSTSIQADENHQTSSQTSIKELSITEKRGVAVVESVYMDNLHNVNKTMLNEGLSVGMVNGEMCASEQGVGDGGGGTSGQQVVFMRNGLRDTQENIGVGGAGESRQEINITVEELSANEAASAGITLSDNDGNLIVSTLTNGLRSLMNGNCIVKGDSPVTNMEPSGIQKLQPNETGSEIVPKPDFNFILQTEMVKGSTFTYGKTWFKCLHCEFKTNTKVTISKHMQEDHVNLIDLQQGLDSRDVTGNDKRKVMKMSTYESIFGRESRFRRCAKKGKRVEKQDIPGVYTCGTCGKVFTRTRYLRKHQETHKTERKYLCDECGKSFKSRTYLQVHRRVHKEKLFRCNQCDFRSKINAAIHAHRQVHSQGSVLCDICGYAYTDKSTLNKHKRVHDLNRPYKCNFPGCTWRFKTEVMCKAHIRAHTTEGKFKCSYCGYLFRHKHHLQRHETSMHGVKHTKTRTNHIIGRKKDMDDEEDYQDLTETVKLVINAEDVGESIALPGDGTQHLVVATDNDGTPIAFEGTDLSALNVSYQTLFQNQDGANGRTLIMSQPDAQIIFKQGY